MKILKSTTWLLMILSLAISCKNKTATDTVQSLSPALQVAGNYTDDSYPKRQEGYDWVAVSVKQTSDTTLLVSVRSRADLKKTTCTFDAAAKRVNDTTYSAVAEGKLILFTFTENSIRIDTENEANKGILNYFCSGGGTLEGTYHKINEPLDEKQIDPTVFHKTLLLQDIGFDIHSTGKGSVQQLSIQPFGLKTDNSIINMEVDGTITGAEIEDLNADGFPEVLIYTMSAGNYGNVIGYSVNKGKSVSRITFPDITKNKEASKGYAGHDEFAIVESNLVQRFKTYNTGDANSTPAGNIRQIQYKLKDGEAGRMLVADKIIEFPAK